MQRSFGSWLPNRLKKARFSVTNTNDSGAGSLRDAITSANSASGADTINFDSPVFATAQTITLSSALPTISDSLTITGPSLTLSGQPRLTVQRNPGGFPPFFSVFDIGNGIGNPGIQVALQNLDIEHGYTFANSGNDGQGGGIRFVGAFGTTGNSLTITNCKIANSNAQAAISSAGNADGGGVYTKNTTLSLTDTTISGNTATAGDGTTTAGDADGGGLFHDGLTATLTRCTFSSNSAQGGNAHQLDPNSTGLVANGGNADGGGLAVTVSGNGTFSMIDSQVLSNTAKGGNANSDVDHGSDYGGIGSNGGMDVVTLDNSGVIATNGTATGSTFALNKAIGGDADSENDYTEVIGGRAYAGGLTVSTLKDSTVFGNTAAGGNATPNSTFLFTLPGGAAGGGFGGGPIFANLPVTYKIFNSTIASNVAISEVKDDAGNFVASWQAIGGGVADGTQDQGGNVTADQNPTGVGICSTLIARNSVNSTDPLNPIGLYGYGPDIYGGFSYAFDAQHYGHNFIGYGPSQNYNGNFPQDMGFAGPGGVYPNPNSHNDIVGPLSDGVTPYDPLFVNVPNVTPATPLLTYNGGPTQTIALQPASPAIDNGQNDNGALAYDQREAPFARTNDGVNTSATNRSDGTDVGAFELQNVAPTVAGVQVNDGSAQRSEVYSITVTFDVPVVFTGGNGNAAAAFQLTHVQDNTNIANLAAAVSTNVFGETAVTLTFTTTGNAATEIDPVSATQPGGRFGPVSLADGRYALTIHNANVTYTGINTVHLAGNGSTAGTDYASPTDTLGGGTGQLHLYRLFGDATGDGIVDQVDLGQFRGAFNTSQSGIGYLEFAYYFDANNDTSVDQLDLGQFRQRFNANVFG